MLYRRIAIFLAGILLLLSAPGNHISFAQTDSSVTGFTLIDADSDQPIAGFDPIMEGAIINLATLPSANLNIRANTSPATVGSVQFVFDGNDNYALENTAPYALQGDSGGDYNDWTPSLDNHTITATPFSDSDAGGEAGTPLTRSFEVVDDPAAVVTVDAGQDRLLTLPTDSVTLAGSAVSGNDSTVSFQWNQTSGPAAATLGGETTATLHASNLVRGVYHFQLVATDRLGGTASDTAAVWVGDPAQTAGTQDGPKPVWHPLTLSFSGPAAAETDDNPNPFLDYRLQVFFQGPQGQSYEVPGFFAGDGTGGSSGNTWQVRFAPDQAGEWTYVASFRQGSDVAVSLAPNAGTAAAFDGATGGVTVEPLDPEAAGFLRWGRLAPDDGHYLKFADGPYWLKGGTDSPENFLGYAGFDNTVDNGGLVSNFLHSYEAHRSDWASGDPLFSTSSGEDSKGIIGALNYLSSRHVNSIYFLPMNLGGDGQETYPFTGNDKTAYDKTHYDLSKLAQWNQVLAHAQRQGIALNIVLAETEANNENWLDEGQLGVERKLYFRELVARFGYLLARKWNLSEENDYSVGQLRAMADYIEALDWNGYNLTVHTHPNNFRDYEQLVGDPRFTATSIQYQPGYAGTFVETWRANSQAAGVPWVLDMDENNPAGTGLADDNADELRKSILYDVYFSGGQIEWYAGYHDLPLGGDVRLEDFRTREAMWDYMWYARRFMETELPFWEMEPADELIGGESSAYGGAEVFARPGSVYAIYLPDASSGGTLDLAEAGSDFWLRWYNPRTGSFEGSGRQVSGDGSVALGSAPSTASEDWVVLLTALEIPHDFSIHLPLTLSWAHRPGATGYELWASHHPYFTLGESGTSRVLAVSDLSGTAIGEEIVFEDSARDDGSVYYALRTFTAGQAFVSPGVGRFSYPLGELAASSANPPIAYGNTESACVKRKWSW